MKKNIHNIIVIILFIAMITLPQIIYKIIPKQENEISETENRMLSSKPKLELSTITEYPKNFDNYYNDHLPFRLNLRNFWATLNYNIFNTTVENGIIVGKNGWLFYRGDESIEQAQGINKYTNEQKVELLEKLQAKLKSLNEMDIETYILILPNKENVYKDYLPKTIPIKEEKSKIEDLINYVEENSDIHIIYPKEELLQAKNIYQVYRKYDTHWNKIGSCIGTVALQSKINEKFDFKISDFIINQNKEKEPRDLADSANLSNELYENIVYVDNFYDNIEYNIEENEQYEEGNSDAKDDRTVLFIGDSFRKNMRDYFTRLYKRTIYVHRNNCNRNMIEEIKPDIIVFEAVERYAVEIFENNNI